ncbi:N-methyltryptophan oxidase [Mycobacteroides abscessus subsp. massiliense]|uniref:N-methyl-L-tryptophan oxidase n=1 Tax=Mycobacteroides abscessus TaxID=36809 RepID=UPI0009A55DCB|nr:N-methyl-L-tryptophan oxidase [Mycobacteroides abscessus]SKH59275.1 N-methyltryptophan oxidase [Mycobacteroides abscessus subsp. massiliense]SKH93068.1 N-methyltryptophan oxidase [Mycobacteroides abscessus subsp. massiliense]SKI13280.1 N-methyltryptophan oxidase [Mycobacteroides abscessus subsp. massiliense]SKJ99388.1 N-methyltryptophan oxidase [Mycobacteroides abscessus subsp. massiliense]SKK28170.1 N-methyltryptophan oxidase [Mycobacteroides abscessus subsp. massiliense]
MSDYTYDVIVVGLGGMGSAAAYHLARRGQRVLGLEKFNPAHNRGSSHGGSRIIRQSYFEDPSYVPLLLRAYELWQELADRTGLEVYRKTGGLFLGPPDCLTVAGSLRASQEWDLPHELLDSAEIRRRFPAFTPGDGDIALYEANAGFARPEMTVQAHLDLATSAGATLRFNEEVLNWKDHADGVIVTTSSGSYSSGQVVICPGAWAPTVLTDLGIPISIERQVLYWLEPTGGVGPFQDGPIFIGENLKIEQIYGFPALDGPGGGVKVAFFRRGQQCTADTIDRVVYPEEIEAMRHRVTELLPALTGPAVRTATCMYSNTPDEHFVITRPASYSNVTVACGFSGHGFKFVPVVGEILADLVVGGTTAHPIRLFDPQRLVIP